jgi:hypothetical protein
MSSAASEAWARWNCSVVYSGVEGKVLQLLVVRLTNAQGCAQRTEGATEKTKVGRAGAIFWFGLWVWHCVLYIFFFISSSSSTHWTSSYFIIRSPMLLIVASYSFFKEGVNNRD